MSGTAADLLTRGVIACGPALFLNDQGGLRQWDGRQWTAATEADLVKAIVPFLHRAADA